MIINSKIFKKLSKKGKLEVLYLEQKLKELNLEIKKINKRIGEIEGKNKK